MSPFIQKKKATQLCLIVFALGCFVLLPNAQAVSPPPDGGYTLGCTAEGTDALFSLEDGAWNTAVGHQALYNLLSAHQNTATGYQTLFSNTFSHRNTAYGAQALYHHFLGDSNTATGFRALYTDTSGRDNTADGFEALASNTNGQYNTGTGSKALYRNTFGEQNTAVGSGALFQNTYGNGNVALGSGAGSNATTGSNNVYIGQGMLGVAGESNACYIASIFGQASASGVPVLINSNNKLGTTTSSKRFKEDIKPMDKASEALFALKPVSFRYKKEIDPVGISQLGLVAEDVEKVNPDLVVRDTEGTPYTVRYDQVNAMLLNEFLKEHRKVEELEANSARQQKQIETLTAGLQKVSAQIEVSKPALQTVNSN
jgi:hypothetical protein